jgi:hypothetical protein
VNVTPHGALPQSKATALSGGFLFDLYRQVSVQDFSAPGKAAVLVLYETQQNFAVKTASS